MTKKVSVYRKSDQLSRVYEKKINLPGNVAIYLALLTYTKLAAPIGQANAVWMRSTAFDHKIYLVYLSYQKSKIIAP